MTQRTTVSVYEQDLDWLKRRQLSVSNRAGKWTHMSDIIHAVIEMVDRQLSAEEGA